MNEERFDDRVRGLYRAATFGQGWHEVLEELRMDVGARSLSLEAVDATDGRLRSHLRVGAGASHEQLDYVREWHRHDPRRTARWGRSDAPVLAAEPGWLHDDARAGGGPFAQHYASAYDLQHAAHLSLACDDQIRVGITLERGPHAGEFGSVERGWIERLARHLLGALRTWGRLRGLMPRALVAAHLLDAMPYAMWLLDADARPLHANAAAERETQLGTWLVLREGRLLPAPTGSADDLGLAEAAACLAAAQHGARRVITWPGADRPRLVLQTVTAGAALAPFSIDRDLPTVVLATLFDPRATRPLDPHAIAQVFDLTPAEARVAVLVAEGRTAAAIAAALAVQETTVRTHVRSLLGKLGVARKTDLVRVIGQAGWMAQRTAGPRARDSWPGGEGRATRS